MELISKKQHKPDITITPYKPSPKVQRSLIDLDKPSPKVQRSLIDPGKQRQDYLRLEDGEEICSDCDGTGQDISWKMIDLFFTVIVCGKCGGKGKLDWVKNAMGCSNNDDCCSSSR